MKQKIIIGARGSKLSLAQTELIKAPLQKLLSDTEIQIQVITTTGDKDMSPVPLDTVGKGWFTKELDRALLDGTIDIAVHSLKDIPEELPEGLIIAAVPQREDAREAMVSWKNILFADLKKHASVGTDSTRRKSQILHMRPDLVVKSLRGNVNRRLQKLEKGEYDAIFLAVAGLKRLGLEHKISQYFDATDFIPSPGQGALAVVARKDNAPLLKILEKLNDTVTVAAVSAERAFSKGVGGGCKMPVGAYGYVEKNQVHLYAMIGSPDGEHLIKQSLEVPRAKSKQAGEKLAKFLLRDSKTWYNPSSHGYIVITRPEEDGEFAKKLQYLNVQVLPYPTIRVVKNALSKKETQKIKNIRDYDMLIFTSRHGVEFFLQTLKSLDIDPKILQKKFVAAVGPKTAHAAEKYDLKVHFIPSEFTTKDLAKELKNVKNKKILLARSQIGNPLLTKELIKKGAIVTNISIYNTEFIGKLSSEFERAAQENSITCITFTSPSTVEGFMKSLTVNIRKTVLSLPVVCIGPVTQKAAEKYGFTRMYTANTYTIDGMLRKIQENIL